jgi:hypothetical protein
MMVGGHLDDDIDVLMMMMMMRLGPLHTAGN